MSKIVPFTPLNVSSKIDVSLQRGEVREALGRAFVMRLEKLADELMAKPDCPQIFWIIYTAKYDYIDRNIKEVWQVTDEKPKVQQLGQIIYKIDKAGQAEYCALPFDIPVPDTEYSDDLVLANADYIKNMPLSTESFTAL